MHQPQIRRGLLLLLQKLKTRRKLRKLDVDDDDVDDGHPRLGRTR
jgi:hypothetical protein